MRKATKASEDAAKAAKVAADAASDNASIAAFALWQNQESSDFTLQQMTGQTAAQEKAANAAKSAAETASNTLDASSKQFRIEERPYITPSGISQDDGAMIDGPNEVKLAIINSGKTPALKITFHPSGFLNDQAMSTTDTPSTLHSEAISAGPLSSTNHFTLTLAPGVADEINSGTVRFTFKVVVKYTDIFKEWHETSICSIWYPKEKEYRYCEHGTDVN